MMIVLIVISLIFGICIVFASRSPYFGIFGVLLQALSFSLLLCLFGLPFFGLLTILIYVGGMLIIFLFSTVLSAERYPDSGWLEALSLSLVLLLLGGSLIDSWSSLSNDQLTLLNLNNENSLGEVFSGYGLVVLLVVLGLLMALLIVLAFGYEHSRITLRKL
uniref:NADH-ubiquinone oxidoreductase chain 6 n=1 Tax=Amphipholis squamata TaxID=48271 RepID=D3H5U8_AMPSQ|nr:NADH dehydrogenase subunit 6 [Amphipholis squamata]